jgi:cytochrome b561
MTVVALKNTDSAWGAPAKFFHWLAAAMILTMLGLGWWMTHMIPSGPGRTAVFSWHAAIGYDLLALTVLRLVWRSLSRTPSLPSDTKPWERIAARIGHGLLYLATFVTAMCGWSLAGTMRTPLVKDLFGISIPSLVVSHDRPIHEFLEDTHAILAYVLAGFIAIHVAGALRHHFVKRNNVLTRMLRAASAEAA